MSLRKKALLPLLTLALSGWSPAAIVYFADQDIPIPTNYAGVSVDLETGLSSTSLGGLPDGDANFFYGGAEISNDADATAASPSWQPVRVAPGSNTDAAASLTAFADVVDAGSTYGSGFGSSGDVSPHFPGLTAGARQYIGFSLVPNAGGPVLYGWMEVTLQTDASDLEGTIHSWAYESDPGVAIVVGAIPEPGAASLALLGLATVLLRRRR